MTERSVSSRLALAAPTRKTRSAQDARAGTGPGARGRRSARDRGIGRLAALGLWGLGRLSGLSPVMLGLACGVGAAAAFSTPAAAQDYAAAGAHFDAGQQAFAAGRYKVAADEFQAAYDITKDPALLFNIGESQQRAGDAKKALVAYRAYVKEQPGAPDRTEVEARIKALEEALAPPPPSGPSGAAPPAQGGTGTAPSGPPTAPNGPPSAQNGVPGAQNGVSNAQNGVLTPPNGVSNAQNGVSNAQNGVPNAQNGVPNAQNGVSNAQNGVPSAQNGVPNAQNGVPSPPNSATNAPAGAANPPTGATNTQSGTAPAPAAGSPAASAAPASPEVQITPPEPRPSRLRTAAWISVASAVAVVTAGAIVGLGAQNRADELRRRTTLLVGDQPPVYDDNQRDAYETLQRDGRAYNTASIALLSIAGVAAVTGGALFIADYVQGKKQRAERAKVAVVPVLGTGQALLTAGGRF